jgi:hypothetical protein
MNEDKPAAPRRRFPLRLALLLLLGVLLAWRFWPRPLAPPAPSWPSALDVLEPARLTDTSWPRDGRPAAAVGVLELDRDADGRLEVSIAEGIILIKDARGQKVVRIDAFAPPKQADRIVSWGPKGPIVFDPSRWNARDDHTLHAAALSPKADRLVVLGRTQHTPAQMPLVIGDASWSCQWAQVWRWEGSTLTPLEVQQLKGQDANAAAFSPDGKLLVTASEDHTDVWEVGDEALRHLRKLSGESKQLLFAPDSRTLAVINPGSVDIYDFGPLLPWVSGWTRWRLFYVALGLLAAVAVCVLVSRPGKTDSSPPPTCWECGGVMIDPQTEVIIAYLPPRLDAGEARGEHKVIETAQSAAKVARAQRRLSIALRAAFLGVGACVAWWVWRPGLDGLVLNIGLGFGAALVVLLLLARAHRRSPEAAAQYSSRLANRIRVATICGVLVCLGLWAWKFWWPSPSLLTPSGSDLASADIRSACFSGDSSELAAVRSNGRLSLFQVTSGKETHGWRMPAGVQRPEYAADGRHLLAVAADKAYVLRLKPFDDTAYILSICEKVLGQDPKSNEALLARGHVHLHKGELDRAIEDFTQVIAQDEKNAAAYHGRGLARTDRGDYVGARDDFAAALRHDPKLADAASRRLPP